MTAPGSANFSALYYELVVPQPAITDLEPGDVIYKTGHIGIVLQDGADRWIYQSNGTPRACNTQGLPCMDNNVPSRGPRLVNLDPDIAGVDGLFAGYSVLRLNTRCDSTVTDIDGNEYSVVKIGSQCWMAENLRTSRYDDGIDIPNVTDSLEWENVGIDEGGACCNYDNDILNGNIYGKLYNGYAAANPNICPEGWHVPTEADWSILVDTLGGDSIAGGKMKATDLWDQPNTGATNESGFTGLPGGGRYIPEGSYSFHSLGNFGNWWSASEDNGVYTPSRGLSYIDTWLSGLFSYKICGNSVRCISD